MLFLTWKNSAAKTLDEEVHVSLPPQMLHSETMDTHNMLEEVSMFQPAKQGYLISKELAYNMVELADEFDVGIGERNTDASTGFMETLWFETSWVWQSWCQESLRTVFLDLLLMCGATILVGTAKAAWQHRFSVDEDESDVPCVDEEAALRLFQAVRSGDVTSCSALLGSIHADVRNLGGSSALHIAADGGTEEIARLLIMSRADVAARDAWEATPLHHAARTGTLPVAKVLLERGADGNVEDSLFQTPLSLSAGAGNVQVCELLLTGGATARPEDLEAHPLLGALLGHSGHSDEW